MVYGICIMNINGMEYLFHNILPVTNKIKMCQFLQGTVYFSDNTIIKKIKVNIFFAI